VNRQPILACILALLVASCQDVQDPRPVVPNTLPELASLIVSEPTPPASLVGTRSSRSTHVTSVGPVYISLPPGSVPNGVQITIMNRATGASVTAPMSGGGVDPIQVEAEEGDTLDVEIALPGTVGTLDYVTLVPLRRPPVVVRTEPPPAKRDVPLNSVMVLVFSEPIKPSVLTDGSVRLLLNGLAVSGTLTFGDAAHLTVAFTPDQQLLLNSSYSLVVTQQVADLNGDLLKAPVTVNFETQPLAALGSNAIAFTRNGHLYVMNHDGSGLRQLTNDPGQDHEPAWSPDGNRIAFTRYRGDRGYMMWGEAAIYVVNTDGSGLLRLTAVRDSIYEADPTWSPDGSRIAFFSHRDADQGLTMEIEVMNADGTNPVRLTNRKTLTHHPSWSPDGARIAFQSWNAAVSDWSIYLMQTDGANPVAIVSGEGGYSPAWSPDGSQILTRAWKCLQWVDTGDGGSDCVSDEGPHLMTVDADGSNPTRVSDYKLSAYDRLTTPAAWSSDGQFIAFTQTSCAAKDASFDCWTWPEFIEILRLSDGQVTRLAQGSAPAWRP
jgi:Tol biopolymer transport system component